MFTLDQLSECQLAAIVTLDHPILYHQGVNLDTELRTSPCQEETPRFGRRIAQRNRRDLNGRTGNGGALVRRTGGVPQHHANLIQGQIQFFRNDLR